MKNKLVIKDKYKGILFIIMAGFFFLTDDLLRETVWRSANYAEGIL